ncbi:sulfatase-like hydrolase/transferase [Rheinheimera sp. UJ51]|uniref:sulfatase-like hydrolase/transferase n=1 Tax=unclassified Rheinheimera TaxID=115860 RepID=UPI001E30CDB1|nr:MULTISPECIES: sulfatase-like hydrolase/transferase [unclassified Rheinheimera]MCC5453383.1 sulfatase-like hydrolase/transferase [Rheinheimera sp. UJ51]MCF4010961.1 sulfatase-like hydrolase/transferase [Rheinheimera sp. UJ63]
MKIQTLLILSMIIALNACHSTEEALEEQPNILFILADDHRWDLLGYKHPIIKTSNLDELANKGFSFENTFVTTPICASSRISILTGLTERTHDFTFSQPTTGEIESRNMYPQILKSKGYQSAFVGKYEIKISGRQEDRFDFFKPLLQSKTEVYDGEEIPQTYYIAALASDFIKSASKSSKPWTMSVNFWNPHAHDGDLEDQFHYPAEFETLYAEDVIPPAKLSEDENFEQLPSFLKKSIARQRWKFRFGTDVIYQKMTKRHYRAISSVDAAVGKIIETLRQTGEDKNTIIIYTGDNGYFMNERQLAGKWFGWDEALRVPLIIFDPRKQNAKQVKVQQFALNIDIAPTILDFAGIKAPDSYQGKSLLPLIYGESVPKWRDSFFFEHMYQPKHASIPPMVGIRTERWKYIDFYKNGYEQLYDLNSDPEEKINLATSQKFSSVLQTLREETIKSIQYFESQRTEEVKRREYFNNTNCKLHEVKRGYPPACGSAR